MPCTTTLAHLIGTVQRYPIDYIAFALDCQSGTHGKGTIDAVKSHWSMGFSRSGEIVRSYGLQRPFMFFCTNVVHDAPSRCILRPPDAT